MTAASLLPVQVPDIGDFEGVPIIEILVSPGDQVALDDPLLTLESDKATMDVPAPFAGTVKALSVQVGDHVSQGDVLLMLEPAEATAAADSVESAVQAEEGDAPQELPAPRVGSHDGPVYASPSVRRLARERSVDLTQVGGTGRKGRITRHDVESFGGRGPAGPAPAGPGLGLEGLAPWPAVEFEKFGPVERVERSRIQRISAPNLARNWVMIPHVTQHDEADITELEAWRKRLGAEQPEAESGRPPVKFTMLSFLVVACVAALKRFPNFNSSLDGEQLVLKHYYNIGFAADTPGGLVVPVVKDADSKGLLQIARELGELSARAREGKLSPADMSGSTFTISSLGGIGGTAFTPIVNAPEVAILGVSRAAIKPIWDGERFAPRLMLPLSLSYDHRVIDGAAAARFTVYLAGLLGDLRQALL